MKKAEIMEAIKAQGIEVTGKETKAQLEEILSNAQVQKMEEQEFEEYVTGFQRANRVAMMPTATGYTARFFRTHKHIGDIEVRYEVKEGETLKHTNEMLRQAREFAIGQCPMNEIEWLPELQAQAWNRKYNQYENDEQVSEDALELVRGTIETLASKGKYEMAIADISVTAVIARECGLSYVVDGKYEKSGNWCSADIEISIKGMLNEQEMDMVYRMQMVSGQIKKPKMTIADWNEMVAREADLNGIQLTA